MLPGFGSRLNFRQSKKHNFTTRIRHESKSELIGDWDHPAWYMTAATGTKAEAESAELGVPCLYTIVTNYETAPKHLVLLVLWP